MRQYAKQNSKQNVAQTFVWFDDSRQKIISYYTTCATSIRKDSFFAKLPFPRGEVPAILIARLAVDVTEKGKKYGEKTLVAALHHIRNLSTQTGIRIVVVDALSADVVPFYKAYGFIPFDDLPLKLFMAIETINKIS